MCVCESKHGWGTEYDYFNKYLMDPSLEHVIAT
jgi:hypothetical protein